MALEEDRYHDRAGTAAAGPLASLIGRHPPGETRQAALFTLLSFFAVGLPRVFTNTAASTLFLQAYGAQALPYAYLAAAVAVPAVGWLYLRLEVRLPFARLVLLVLLADVAALAVARLGLGATGLRWPTFAVAVWVEVEWVLTSLAFWGLAERSFDIRQAKRLFGIIGAGGPTAVVAGGLAVPALLTVIGTADLLWLSLGSITIAMALVAYMTEGLRERHSEHHEREADIITPQINSNHKRYLYLVFSISIVSVLVHYCADIAFYDVAEARYPSEADLATFIGIFSAGAGLLDLLCGLFVFGQLMRGAGLLAGLLALPLVTLAASLSVVSSGLIFGAAPLIFWLVAMTKLADESLRDGIHQPSFLVLYQPLPPQRRTRAQAVNETLVEPAAAGASGLILLVLANVLGSGAVGFLTAALVSLAVWIVLSWVTYREYLAVLAHALVTRRLGRGTLPLDEASLAVVKGLLASPRPGEVLHCLALLQALDDRSIEPLLAPLLTHPAREARLETLGVVERRRLAGLAEVVAGGLADPDPGVRGAALRTLAALREAEAAELLIEHLGDRSAEVRSGAMVGLMRHVGIEGVLAAGPRLLALAGSPDARDRRSAADTLGELGIRQFYRPLRTLLGDPDPEVRHAALRSAKVLNVPELWPSLTDALRSLPLAGAAADALAAAGEEVYPLLEELFRSVEATRHVRRWIVWVYGRGPKASERPTVLLKDKLASGDRLVRREAIRALRRRGFRAAGADADLVVRLLRRTLASTVWICGLLDRTGGSAETGLLRDALAHEVGRHQDRIFRLLSLLYPATVIDQARHQFGAGTAERRAYAVEVLDTLVSGELRAVVVPTLEPAATRRAALTQEAVRAGPGGRYGCLTAIVSDSAHELSPWAKACALYAMGRLARGEFRSAAAAAAESGEPLIRETATWALDRLPPGRDLAPVKGEGSAATGPSGPDHAGRRRAVLTTVERVLILKEVGMFSAVQDEYLADIAPVLTEAEVPVGTTIIRAGDIGRTMYVIITGRVRVHRDGLTLAELGEREVFGELAALDPEPRSASVEALEDTRVFQLSNEHLDELMAVNVEIARGIIRMLCRRFRSVIATSGARLPGTDQGSLKAAE